MGGNYATEGILPESWFYNPKDLKLLKGIQKKFGTRKIKSFPTFDYKLEMYYKFIKGIRIIYILNYLPFSKEEAIETLKEKSWVEGCWWQTPRVLLHSFCAILFTTCKV